MSGALRLRKARATDAADLAPRLRAADRAELGALGLEPAAALAASASAGRARAVVDPAGQVVGLCGVGIDPEAPWIGGPWLLCADALAAQPRAALKLARSALPGLSVGCRLLVNRADARNRLHLAWIRALGFSLLAARPLGPERRLFVEFVKLGPAFGIDGTRPD